MNYLEELEKLSELKTNGVLTPEEFEVQKARVLKTPPHLTVLSSSEYRDAEDGQPSFLKHLVGIIFTPHETISRLVRGQYKASAFWLFAFSSLLGAASSVATSERPDDSVMPTLSVVLSPVTLVIWAALVGRAGRFLGGQGSNADCRIALGWASLSWSYVLLTASAFGIVFPALKLILSLFIVGGSLFSFMILNEAISAVHRISRTRSLGVLGLVSLVPITICVVCILAITFLGQRASYPSQRPSGPVSTSNDSGNLNMGGTSSTQKYEFKSDRSPLAMHSTALSPMDVETKPKAIEVRKPVVQAQTVSDGIRLNLQKSEAEQNAFRSAFQNSSENSLNSVLFEKSKFRISKTEFNPLAVSIYVSQPFSGSLFWEPDSSLKAATGEWRRWFKGNEVQSAVLLCGPNCNAASAGLERVTRLRNLDRSQSFEDAINSIKEAAECSQEPIGQWTCSFGEQGALFFSTYRMDTSRMRLD